MDTSCLFQDCLLKSQSYNCSPTESFQDQLGQTTPSLTASSISSCSSPSPSLDPIPLVVDLNHPESTRPPRDSPSQARCLVASPPTPEYSSSGQTSLFPPLPSSHHHSTSPTTTRSLLVRSSSVPTSLDERVYPNVAPPPSSPFGIHLEQLSLHSPALGPTLGLAPTPTTTTDRVPAFHHHHHHKRTASGSSILLPRSKNRKSFLFGGKQFVPVRCSSLKPVDREAASRSPSPRVNHRAQQSSPPFTTKDNRPSPYSTTLRPRTSPTPRCETSLSRRDHPSTGVASTNEMLGLDVDTRATATAMTVSSSPLVHLPPFDSHKLLLVGPAICKHLQNGGGVRVKDFNGAIVGWMH